MSIKIIQNVDEDTFKNGFKSTGVHISVKVDEKNSSIILYVKKLARIYHRLVIDIDRAGFKVSEHGRKELKKLIDFYGPPDVREPKRDFINTYVLDVEVQRGDDTFEGELRILDQLFLLLEKDENLERPGISSIF